MSNYRKGIRLAIITALVSGVSIFINKFAVGAIESPLVFTATKNIGVGLMIIFWLLLSGKILKIRNLSKSDFKYLFGIGLIGGAVPFYLFFTGLTMIPAINAALIHKSLILFVAILALFFLKEKMNRTMVIAVILLFLSNFIIGGFRGLTYSTGEVMVLAATIIWAVETIIAKKALKFIDPDILTSARMGFGSLILIGASLITSPSEFASIFSLNATQTFWILATMFTLLLYVTSWYRALKYAPATSVAAVLVASTVVTNLLSAFFITHVLNVAVLAQSGVMLFCVWLVYKATAEIKNAENIRIVS